MGSSAFKIQSSAESFKGAPNYSKGSKMCPLAKNTCKRGMRWKLDTYTPGERLTIRYHDQSSFMICSSPAFNFSKVDFSSSFFFAVLCCVVFRVFLLRVVLFCSWFVPPNPVARRKATFRFDANFAMEVLARCLSSPAM